MKLYFSPGACSLAPHIVLRETNLSFTPVRVDLAAHKTSTGEDYYAVNPKGSVPVLELDDGERLTEGPVIAQWVCDRANRADLMPVAGSMARYRVMEWQNYITSELHKSYSPLFRADFDDNGKTWFRNALRKKYEWVASRLDGKDFLTGPNFTAADAYLYVVTRWAGHVKVDLNGLSALQAFMRRVNERDAVQSALTTEGLPLKLAA
jgi:glutathione S-transferase